MVRLSRHGGNCCGVRHFHDLSDTFMNPITEATLTAALRQEQAVPRDLNHNGGRTKGKVVEAVVTDTQLRYNPELAGMLRRLGFKLVTRFHNNTGGMCNILHRVTGGRDIQQAARRNAHVRTLIS